MRLIRLLVIVLCSMAFASNTIAKKPPFSYTAQGIDYKYSINEVLKDVSSQIALCQKIAKAYVAISDEKIAALHKKELLTLIERFESIMGRSLEMAPSLMIKASVEDVAIMWRNYKKLVLNQDFVSEGKVSIVLIQSEALADACEDVLLRVSDYAKENNLWDVLGNEINPAVNSYKRLSNELLRLNETAAIYFMLELRINCSIENKEKLAATVDAFDVKFAEIQGLNLSDNNCKKLFISVYQHWDWIKKASAKAKLDDLDEFLNRSYSLSRQLEQISSELKTKTMKSSQLEIKVN